MSSNDTPPYSLDPLAITDLDLKEALESAPPEFQRMRCDIEDQLTEMAIPIARARAIAANEEWAKKRTDG